MKRDDAEPCWEGCNQFGETVGSRFFKARPRVLFFYPFALSQLCHAELRDMFSSPWLGGESQSGPGTQRQQGFDVIAVSCDSRYVQRSYADQLRELSGGSADTSEAVHMVSDFWPHGEISRAFQVFDAKRGCPERVSIFLDRGNRVVDIHRPGANGTRDINAMFRTLSAL